MGILTDEMQRLVREVRLGFVATVNADGTPNLSPKGTVTVWDDDHLAFADIASPGTVDNLGRSAAVEVNVVDQFLRRGFRFKGAGTVHREGDVFEEGVRRYEASGTARARERIRGIVLVRVERALPVVSPAYELGLTEAQILDQWWRHWAMLRGPTREDGGADSPD